jgi:purine nucleosidase
MSGYKKQTLFSIIFFMKEKIIMDTDWGSDQSTQTSVLLARPDQFEILGAMVTFGNAAHPHVLRNAGDLLQFLGASDIPYYPGSTEPSDQPQKVGDNAFGNNGIGDVQFEPAKRPPEEEHAVDYLLDTLKEHEDQSITLLATGPQANISRAIKKDPQTMKRLKRILIMGGGVEEMPAADRPTRRGNIEHDAEFNFNQAPHDADVVVNSGIPIILFPLNCTHQITLTETRRSMIRDAFTTKPDVAEKIIKMLMAPQELERTKFGIDPVLHDVNTALYLVAPEQYSGRQGFLKVVDNGRSDFTEDSSGPVLTMDTIKDPDALFEIILTSLKDVLLR